MIHTSTKSKRDLQRSQHRGWVLAIVLACFVAMMTCAAAPAAEVRVNAMSGEPFGIAEITFPVTDECELAWHCRAFRIEEANGRVLYPILDHGGLLQRLAARLGGSSPKAPPRAAISFLFVGDEPLEITLHAAEVHRFTINPDPHRAAKHARMGRAWWKKIWGPVGERLDDGNRPRPVENYVAGMGLYRMGINRHPARHKTSAGTLEEMVIGTARMRSSMARAVSFGWADQGAADQPLLPALGWSTIQLPSNDDVKMEDIAYRVPDNCIYLRFAKFTNMLWVLRLLESNGEELQRLITTRGFRGNASAKVQRQLAIQELPFADLIGDRLIDDVALVCRDIFLTDGPALGVVLKVKSSIFTSGLRGVRKQAVESMKDFGATEKTVEIEGRKVSFISTPDNRLRSFHVVDGKWQMLTNSRAIAASFLRTGDKKQLSLADSPTFQQLRSEMPPEKNDTLFAYVPTGFFEAFTAPEYIIELQRRTRAQAELKLLEVAKYAARQESRALAGAGRDVPPETEDVVTGLSERGLLPPSFGVRSDASRPMWRDGRPIDSLRGGVGTFLPVPDVEITKATVEENRVYQRFVNSHAGRWSTLDPIMLRMRKTPSPNKRGRDQLLIDARVTPLQQNNATILLGLLGKHRLERMRPHKDALFTAEAMISSSWVPTNIDTHAQLTVLKGPRVEPVYGGGIADLLALAKRVPSRLLVEPANSAFDRRWWRPAVRSEVGEYWYGPFDLIGRRMADHAAISFDQRNLLNAPEKIDWERLETPAQAWIHCEDLEGSSLEDAVTSLAAVRAMSGSIKNAQIFHQWTELLGLPASDGATLAKSLVGMDPVCPLGGRYELVADGSGHEHWQSSSWARDSISPKDLPDYYPALLRWCHGIDASLDLGKEGLHLKAVVEVDFAERDEEKSKSSDEELNGKDGGKEVVDGEKKPASGKGGFKLPFSILGGSKKSE